MSSRRKRRPALPSIELLEDRSLMSASPLDDFGNTLASAAFLDLPATLSAGRLGRIDYAGDVDVFRFTATSSGSVAADLLAGRTSNLDGLLVLHDENGTEIARNDNRGGDSSESRLAFRVEAGRSYYIEASASPFSPPLDVAQNYVLALTPFTDDFGSILADASPTTFSDDVPLVVDGSIETAGDTDVFRLVAPSTGGLSIVVVAGQDSGLDTQLTVLDASGNVLGRNDDLDDSLDSLLTLRVQQGQELFVRVGASAFAVNGTSSGTYALTALMFADEAGSTPTDAAPIALTPSGTTNVLGNIGAPGDGDVYRLVAGFSGPVVVEQVGRGPLDSVLALLDSAGNEVARNDNVRDNVRDSRLLFQIETGQTYFLRAGSRSTSTGDYLLTLRSYVDDAPNVVGSGVGVELDQSGQAIRNGRIETVGDVDVYRFIAPFTGDLNVTLDAGTTFGGAIGVRNVEGGEIARQADVDRDGRAKVILGVSAGQSYEVVVTAGTQASGDYQLRLAPTLDEFPDDFDSAHVVVPSANGSLTLDATLGSGDIDYFRFVSPFSGSLAVRADAAPGSGVDPTVDVIDDVGTLIASNDDTGGSRNARVAFEVVSGTVYYVRVATGFNGPGEFRLTLAPYADDASGDLSSADIIDVAATGTTTQQGNIEVTGDLDAFRFVAPFSGSLIVRQEAVGSGLDSFLTIRNAQGDVVAQDDESGGRHNARVTLDVVQGQVYYAVAAAFGPSFSLPASGETGAYRLVFSPAGDDFGNTIATAQVLDPAALPLIRTGEIERAFDVDVFSFTPTTTAGYVIRQQSAGGFFDSYLTLLDSAGNELAVNDDDGVSLNSRLDVTLTAGETYYLQAGAFSSSIGLYSLSIRTVVDDVPNEIASALGLTLTNNRIVRAGEIETSGDVDVYSFTATRTGGVVIREEAVGPLDALLTVYDADGNQLAQNDDSNGTLDSLILINVVQGRTYYVQAGAYASSSGAYALLVQQYDDNAPNVIAADNPVLDVSTTTSVELLGSVEIPGDADVFQFTAPITGRVTVHLNNRPGGGFLDGFLQVSTSNGSVLTSNDDAGATIDSTVDFDVVVGETYSITASASRFAVGTLAIGNYTLVVDPVQPPSDDFGNDIATAGLLTLSSQNAVSVNAHFERAGDLDFFRFVAPQAGIYAVRAENDRGVDPMVSVFDSAGNLVAISDDSDGTLNSRTSIAALAGETFFIRANAFGGAIGDYRLLVHPNVFGGDDVPDVLADAPWQFVDTNSPLSFTLDLDSPWDRDVFAVVTLTPGQVVLRVTPQTASFVPRISVFDFQGQGGPHLTSDGLAIPETTFPGGVFFLYYVEVAAADIGTSVPGSYQLDVFYADDDAPDIITDNAPLTFSPTNTIVRPGTLGIVGDLDNFTIDAPFTGSMTFELTPAAGSSVVPHLIVRDAQRRLLAEGAGDRATFTLSVEAGARYYIEASGDGFNLGDYVLNVFPAPDEAGSTLGTATVLPAPFERVVQSTLINNVGDVDVYSFTATRTGDHLFRFRADTGSVLDTNLQLLDASGNLLAQNDDFDSPNASQFTTSLQAGQTYFLRASASAFALNTFAGDRRIGAGQVVVEPTTPLGSFTQTTIDSFLVRPGGADLYRVVAPFSGSLTIREQARNGSGLDSFITVYDANYRQTARNNDSGGTLNSELVLNVIAGQILYVEAGSSSAATSAAQTGDYRLDMSFGAAVTDQASGATPIVLSPAGQGSASGTLVAPGQQQAYRFTATTTGTMSVRSLATGSALNSMVHVYDSADQLLGAASGADAQATFSTIARQTYYVRVSASPFAASFETTGNFSLALGPDDAGNNFAGATQAGSSTQGSLDGSGDIDVFQFTATTTGTATVDVSALSGSRLNATLAAFDSSSTSLTDDGRTLTFSVTAGETYFVSVSAGDSSSSKYSLDVSFETTLNLTSPTPTTDTGSLTSGSSSSGDSGDSSTIGNLDLFNDPSTLDDAADELASDLENSTSLSQVDDSSALVAVLLVGAGEEDPAEGKAEAEEGSTIAGRLDDFLDEDASTREDEPRELDPRLTDALFALQADLEKRQFRRGLVEALMPDKLPDAMVKAVLSAARKVTAQLPTREPDIGDLLIPEPKPSTTPQQRERLDPTPESMPEPTEDETPTSSLDPTAAAFVLAGMATGGLSRRRRTPSRKRGAHGMVCTMGDDD